MQKQDVNFDNIIIVNADRWGRARKWWEEKNPIGRGFSRWVGEKAIGSYKEKMDVLREVDDKIYDWTKDLDGIVDQVEKSFKNRRILDAAMLLAKIDQRLRNVENEARKIENMQEGDLQEFSTEDMESLEAFKQWQSAYNEKEKIQTGPEGALPFGVEATIEASLSSIKTAGLLDDWGRRFVAERVQGGSIKARNLAIQGLINRSKDVVQTIQTYVDELGGHRRSGQIGKYLEVLKKIETSQQKFQTEFGKVYNNYLKKPIDAFLEQHEREISEQKSRQLREQRHAAQGSYQRWSRYLLDIIRDEGSGLSKEDSERISAQALTFLQQRIKNMLEIDSWFLHNVITWIMTEISKSAPKPSEPVAPPAEEAPSPKVVEPSAEPGIELAVEPPERTSSPPPTIPGFPEPELDLPKSEAPAEAVAPEVGAPVEPKAPARKGSGSKRRKKETGSPTDEEKKASREDELLKLAGKSKKSKKTDPDAIGYISGWVYGIKDIQREMSQYLQELRRQEEFEKELGKEKLERDVEQEVTDIRETERAPGSKSPEQLMAAELPIEQAPPTSPTPYGVYQKDLRSHLLMQLHNNFSNALNKLSEYNNPKMLASAMVKYAGLIEDIDPDKSLKLLAIAEGVIDG